MEVAETAGYTEEYAAIGSAEDSQVSETTRAVTDNSWETVRFSGRIERRTQAYLKPLSTSVSLCQDRATNVNFPP